MKRKFEGEDNWVGKKIKVEDENEQESEEYYTIENFIREFIYKMRKKKLKNKKK